MTILIIGLGTLLLIILLIRIAIGMADELGRKKAEDERLKKDMEIAKKRAEEMLKEQSVGQTINDLRNNKF